MDSDAEFLMVYCSIVSMQFHPGVKERRSAAECCVLADKYFREVYVWRGLVPPLPPVQELSAG